MVPKTQGDLPNVGEIDKHFTQSSQTKRKFWKIRGNPRNARKSQEMLEDPRKSSKILENPRNVKKIPVNSRKSQ